MNRKKMHHELEMIDGAIAELEQRRTELINRIVACNSLGRNPSKILQFPYRVTVTRSARGPAGSRTNGSKAKPSDKG